MSAKSSSPSTPWQLQTIMDAQCSVNKFNLGSAHHGPALLVDDCVTRQTSVGALLLRGLSWLPDDGWWLAQTAICWRYASLSFQIDLCHESVFLLLLRLCGGSAAFLFSSSSAAFLSRCTSHPVQTQFNFLFHSLTSNLYLLSPWFFYFAVVLVSFQSFLSIHLLFL